MPRTLSRRLHRLARTPILGLPLYLLALFAALIWLADTCTGGGLSH